MAMMNMVKNKPSSLLGHKYLLKAIEFANQNNIIGEPSGLSSLGLFFQLDDKNKIETNKKILIVNTGKLKIDSNIKSKDTPKFVFETFERITLEFFK